jgi:SAM-dependent methyltransferase
MSSSSSSEVNKKSYHNDSVVRYWSTYSSELFYGESKIFASLKTSLAEASLLDVGVGGGRTTPHLLPYVRDYKGLDYSSKLISQCKDKIPGVDFICADASRLSAAIDNASLDFIYFSFNGIDCLDEAQRQSFLQESHQALKPQGRLLFSSHNFYASKPQSTASVITDISRRSIHSLLSLKVKPALRTMLSAISYVKNRSRESQGKDIVFLADAGQSYREVYAWIKPEKQIQDLITAGFKVVSIYDWQGRQYDPEDCQVIRSHSAYYLAEKSKP